MNKQELEQAIRAANEAGARYRPVESVKPKVLANALAGFARGCPAGEAVALYDTTILSSGKTGFLVSTTAIYHDSFDFLLKKGGSKRLALDGLVGLEPDQELDFYQAVYTDGSRQRLYLGKVYQNAVLPVICSGISSLFFYRAKEEDRTILGLLRALYDLERGPDYELSCVELLCGLMRGLLPRVRSQAGPSEGSAAGAVSDARFLRIQKMIAFIERHYARPLTVDEIARAGEVSRRECFRDFRALVGQTPTEFLNQRRLSAAAYLLVSTSRPVSEISECCGFESESYFGRLFRRRYGLPPKHFAARRLLPQRSAP